MRSRIVLAAFIAVCAQPSLPEMPVIGLGDPGALGVLVQQVLIGFSIGFTVRLVFTAVEMAGEVVGFQMGLNFAAFFDPASNAQVGVVSRFYGQIATLLFIVLNGYLMVLFAVVQSFRKFPVDQNFLGALAQLKIHTMGAEIFSSALWMALPMVGILLFVNIAMGVISRVAPQINIFAVGFPITLVAGLVAMAVTMPMLDGPFTALLMHAVDLFGAQ